MIALGGLALILIGALALYLASPNQRALAQPLGAGIGWGAAAAVLLGTAALFTWSGPATSIFIACTAAMLVWSVVPPAVAWWRGPKEKA